MSKQRSDSLFLLIHSLSKGEKRFFKVYASRLDGGDTKKFILLFDAIEKQRSHNEERIMKLYPSIRPQQLSNLKAHLYEQVLKSLHLLNSNRLKDVRITDMIDQARILYSKCLYKECGKMLEKAKKKATEADRSVALLEILELEKLMLQKTISSGNEQRVNSLIREEEDVAESIRNLTIFSNLSLRLHSYYVRSGFIRSKQDLTNVKRFFTQSLPVFKEESLSFHERMHLYNAHIGFCFYIQDFKKGHLYARKLVDLFENEPIMRRSEPEMYIRAINSLLVVQNKLQDYDAFVQTQKSLVAIKRDKSIVLTENVNLNLFKAIYIHEINRHFMLGEFRSGTRIVGKLQPELERFIPLLDKHSVLLFYYKIACLYIGSSNFKTGLKWLNKIYREREDNIREDIFSFTRILMLVCFYELGDDQSVEGHIRSTYRYFRKRGDLSKYQHQILFFLKHLFVENNERTLRRRFMELKQKMLLLEKNPYEKRAFLYFDIISWLESKIQGRSIQELIQEKRKRIKISG